MLPRVSHPILAVLASVLFCSFAAGQDACPTETGNQRATENAVDRADEKPNDDAKAKAKQRAKRQQDAKKRADSLRKLADRLEIRPGATIADIGAGKGRDTWVFADIVGSKGKVFAVEITEKSVIELREAAASRGLDQISATLGRSETPNLPEESVDLAFMHYVYHHLAQPRRMLQSLWKSLKPGGYYVVVDRHKGTLVDWVPREQREKKHFWLAETTFIREAREAGFEFIDFGEDEWFAKKDIFVMIMQRPVNLKQPGHDPDPIPPIDPQTRNAVLNVDVPALAELSKRSDSKIAFVALNTGRELIAPTLRKHPRAAIDIVLEEWATQKDERPETPPDVKLASVLTNKGDLELKDQSLAAVYFLDTYHLLFHGERLLSRIHDVLAEDGRVVILDRKADTLISHREASHRRMIAPATVADEMSQYGFEIDSSPNSVTAPRFLSVFRKVANQ